MKRGMIIVVLSLFLLITAVAVFGNMDFFKFGINAKVIDSGVYLNENEIIKKFEDMRINDKNIYLVYGDEKKVMLLKYEEINQTKIVSGIGSNLNIKNNEIVSFSAVPENGKAKILAGNKEYTINTGKEKIFYIVKADE